MLPVMITGIVNADDPALPLVSGGRVAIHLLQTTAQDLRVEFNGVAVRGVTSGFDSAGKAALLIGLDPDQAGLRAGQATVCVIRPSDGARSRNADISILPRLAEPPSLNAGRTIRARLVFPVSDSSRVSFRLFPAQGAPDAVTIACLARPAVTAEVTAPAGNLAPGRYLLSVEIDGLGSPLDCDDGRREYVGPVVEIPPVV